MQENLLIFQAVKAQGDMLKEVVTELEKRVSGPEDVRLVEAKRLEQLAHVAEQFDNLAMAKAHRQHAQYLRTCVKRGIDA